MKSSFRKSDVLTLLGYCIYVVLATFIAFVYQPIDFTKWIQLFFWIVVTHIIITVICLKTTGVKLFSTSGIFVALSYAFHLGQVLIKGITNKYNFSFDVSMIISQDIYIYSMLFSLLFISLVSLGIMLAKVMKKNEKKEEIPLDKVAMYKTTLLLGWIILMFSLPIEIYYSITQLYTASQSGYIAALQVESSGILSQIGRFHIIGVALLIMGYSNKPYKSTLIFIVYSVYSVVTMLSGIRIYPLISMIVLIYVLFRSKKKDVYLKTFMIFSIPVFFLAILLNTIADIREKGLSNINEITTSFLTSLNNNPLLDILEEFGATIYTVCLTILKVPVSVNYSHGIQFITGAVTVLPNINGIFTNVNDSLIYTKYFNVDALGGSYIGEFYYSFGYYSLLAAVVLGYIIQKFSYQFDFHLINSNFVKAAYYILPVFFLFLWVRGYYVGILRNSIWAACCIYFIYMFFVTFVVKEKKKKN